MVLSFKQEQDSADLLFLAGLDGAKDSVQGLFGDEEMFPDIVSIPVEDLSGASSDESSRRSSVLSTPQFVSISPEEMFMNPPSSIDPSSSLLTSPFDSPNDLYETSPMFDSHDVGNPEHWPSLFGDAPKAIPPPPAPAPLSDAAVPASVPSRGRRSSSVISTSTSVSPSESPLPDIREEGSESPEGVIVAADGSIVGISERKRKRVTSQSYARRPRAEPLPPIVVDDAEDVTAVKRARNTLAARRSRERKMLRLTDLEKQVDELNREHDSALARIKELESEVARLRGL
ncbi:hypothetical protein POJ06DRAFT_58718 [Lipomyces tetrasporus]|uniref:BZIP domain-containing protein n=1 Tax=Lipomyces tetrasporus TaxID=54092 RepID=A0AAD7QWS3_9ASCO|nr:uncharacterized protein POJ06DRAFT_58718 [Lipomyces tetrasporus]KAJ8102905.1 hypothetical protein POJ06DRAFT_58718 [Lipomyces tetrasporus]